MVERPDVVVIGTGLAGVCAAIAAARNHASVILVGDRPMLGGNSSSEIRMWTRGATGAGNLYAEEMGILGELKLRNLQTNPDGNVLLWDEVLLDAVYKQPNISLLLNTIICEVAMRNDQIVSVTGYQLGSERKVTLKARLYIDCTGDGTIAAKAGVPFHVGQEAASAYREDNAPAEASAHTMGSSILFSIKQTDHPVSFIAPEYVHTIPEIQRIIDRGGRIVDEKQNGCDYWWFEYGGLMNTISDAQEINCELKRLALGVWNYIKNSGMFHADYLTLEWIGSIAGKRESRRMTGDYTLTQNDVITGKSFVDNAFYGGWHLDFHPSAGIYSSEDHSLQKPVNVYPIPMRTLFNRSRPNILFAGRILSATHAAFSSTRIMDTCAQSGQAAGTLAALCIQSDLPPSDMVQMYGKAVQQALLRDDMLVIGAVNEDPADLARQATVRASSYLRELPAETDERLPLHENTYVQVAVPGNTQFVQLYLYGDREQTVPVRLYVSPIPSRLVPGRLLETVSASFQPGKPTILPLAPSPENRMITMILPASPSLWLETVKHAPAGFRAGYCRSTAYVYPKVGVGLGDLYSPAQVLSGIHRPYLQPSLWIADFHDPAPWLSLCWEQPVTFSTVTLFLNPDLCQELPSSFTHRWSASHEMTKPKPERPWELAHAMKLCVMKDHDWIPVAAIKNNWQRRVEIRLPEAVSTTELRITFEPSNQIPTFSAQVFEVRIK